MSPRTPLLVACPDCDALQSAPRLVRGGCADCVRCGAELFRDKPHGLEHTFAFVLAAAILFAFANVFPIMELDANGLHRTSTLVGTALALHRSGMTSVAALVFATAILFPALEIAALLYMIAPLRLGIVPWGLRAAFRAVTWLRPWTMVEVFLLGALITFVKLRDIATVHPNAGLIALAGFVMLLAAADAAFEPRAIWQCAHALASEPRRVRPAAPRRPA